MPEINSEAAAENALLAAVMAPDEQLLDAPDIEKPQDIDEPDDELEGQSRESGEEEQAETKTKAEPAADEEDYVEIAPAVDGAEPTKIKVADLVASHQAYEKLRGQEAQIVERVEREAMTQATGRLQQIETFAKQTATHIQAALQVLQAPQPPNADAMLNPASPQYDPDGYHRAFAGYQRAMGQFEQVRGYANQLTQQAQTAAQAAIEQRETAELNKLKRVWPEFGDTETTNAFVSEMGKFYGYSQEELDASLNDHRNALVARDALAYRKLMAKSGDVKKEVETKKPTLVRSKQESKAGSAHARDGKGQFVSGALADLKKTNSDEAATRFFTGLVKAGRI